jgi:hypothetical protein
MNNSIEQELEKKPALEEVFADPAFEEMGVTTQPASNTVRGPSLESKAADWQARTDEVVESALLAVPDTVAGVQLKPFSTARGSLLRRIGNEFVQGVKLSDIADPFLSVGKFLLIMSAELPEARRLVANPVELEDQTYALLDRLPMADIGATVKTINAYVHREMGNQVHGSVYESEGAKTPDGPKN